MNSKQLLSIFVEDKKSGKLDFDVIYDTWQASYVRFAAGMKKNFNSIEHFYLSVIRSDKNPSYGYLNQAEWIGRVSWIDWCLNLKIEQTNANELKDDFENAIEELKSAEDLNEQQQSNINKIVIPINIVAVWSIEETKDRKNPVGPTWSKIVQASDSYFYMERHWES